jgi:hypothetical protein
MGKLREEPPIAALIKKKPWLFLSLLHGEIPVAAEVRRAPGVRTRS